MDIVDFESLAAPEPPVGVAANDAPPGQADNDRLAG